MIIILMGVSGSGKTTLGKKLAQRMGCPFHDADDFHPAANKEKMGKGIALTDGDRMPWLAALVFEMKKWEEGAPATILACSALKEKYRVLLSREVPVRWVFLKGTKEVIRTRLEARQGHFMPGELLDSQFRDLEEPLQAIRVDISGDPDKIADSLAQQLGGK